MLLALWLLDISKQIQSGYSQGEIIIPTHIFLLAELPELFLDLLPELLLLLYLILIGF